MIPLMFFDFIKGDALPLMRGSTVSGGWVQWYNVSTGEVGRQWDGCGMEVLACVFVYRAGETAGMAKNIEQIRDGCKVASCKTLM